MQHELLKIIVERGEHKLSEKNRKSVRNCVEVLEELLSVPTVCGLEVSDDDREKVNEFLVRAHGFLQ